MNRIELPSSLSCPAISEAGAGNACLLVTKLVLIALYYKFKHFTNIFYLIITSRSKLQFIPIYLSINKFENNTLHSFKVCKCSIK